MNAKEIRRLQLESLIGEKDLQTICHDIKEHAKAGKDHYDFYCDDLLKLNYLQELMVADGFSFNRYYRQDTKPHWTLTIFWSDAFAEEME